MQISTPLITIKILLIPHTLKCKIFNKNVIFFAAAMLEKFIKNNTTLTQWGFIRPRLKKLSFSTGNQFTK
jgi:hypothetical protein